MRIRLTRLRLIGVPLCAFCCFLTVGYALAQEGVTYGPQTCMYIQVGRALIPCSQYVKQRAQQQANAARLAQQRAYARWQQEQAAAEKARQDAINAQIRAYNQAQVNAKLEAARQAETEAAKAHEDFIRDRDTYAARLRDVADAGSGTLRLAQGSASGGGLRIVTSEAAGTLNDVSGTLRVPNQESFSRNGTRVFNTGIADIDPDKIIVRRTHFTAAARVLCAQSITQGISVSTSDETLHFLADQALQAMNGAEMGVPCDYGDAGRLQMKKAPQAAAALRQLKSTLVDIRKATAPQQYASAGAKPNRPQAAPTAAPDDGLHGVSNDDSQIRDLVTPQPRPTNSPRKAASSVHKTRQTKIDELVLEAQAALKRAESAEKKAEGP